jgi:hypothetical protein
MSVPSGELVYPLSGADAALVDEINGEAPHFTRASRKARRDFILSPFQPCRLR